MLPNYPFFVFDGATIQQFPLLHAFEFFMGCAAAIGFHQGNSLRGEIPLLLLITYFAYACCTIQWPHIWDHSVIDTKQSCAYWQHEAEYSFKPGKLITVTSIVWVAIIHWLACSESRGDCNILNQVLNLDIFKVMAKYSLQVYLSHFVTIIWLEYALKGLNILDWFSKEFHMVYAYSLSYAIYIYVQPKLDQLAGISANAM